MKQHTLLAIAIVVFVSGCATKRYPIATQLSGVEVELMNCRELAIELARTEETQRQILETAETDWRSVAGFLGDYGIGNSMAKSEAEKALADRRSSISTAQARKGCLGLVSPEESSESKEAIRQKLEGMNLDQ